MFEIGRLYKRSSEIHDVYGGQRQGGISSPKNHPCIFIFTGQSGEAYGYQDEFQTDGIFWYTGEGQKGDMSFVRGNRAIRDHHQSGKTIYIFESPERSKVKYIGTGEYVGYHFTTRKDVEGNDRQVIVFHLIVESAANSGAVREEHADYGNYDLRTLRKKSLAELRQAAATRVPNSDELNRRMTNVYYRSEAIKQYCLKRANGYCEACQQEAPFKTKIGPYLECHHIFRVADGGPDAPRNVIGLCPNCHRRAHYSIDANVFNDHLKELAADCEQRGSA